ncbi:hypothetical protein TorRG33x02_183780 [Trema orientale]|uniref:Uncharacterized protein n=1 Tax=Trema orientale TaxID=63057 RepID=A0A2P5EJR3_TREOI|nr:hypothetical protein TorRG33x02_183780 [Trema orientale]
MPQRWRGWAGLDSWPNVQELRTNERCKLRDHHLPSSEACVDCMRICHVYHKTVPTRRLVICEVEGIACCPRKRFWSLQYRVQGFFFFRLSSCSRVLGLLAMLS